MAWFGLVWLGKNIKNRFGDDRTKMIKIRATYHCVCSKNQKSHFLLKNKCFPGRKCRCARFDLFCFSNRPSYIMTYLCFCRVILTSRHDEGYQPQKFRNSCSCGERHNLKMPLRLFLPIIKEKESGKSQTPF